MILRNIYVKIEMSMMLTGKTLGEKLSINKQTCQLSPKLEC
jgi:hypothetical protein